MREAHSPTTAACTFRQVSQGTPGSSSAVVRLSTLWRCLAGRRRRRILRSASVCSSLLALVRSLTSLLVSPLGCARPASSVSSSEGPQRRCRRCRSRDFGNCAESTIVTIVGGSNLVLGVWLHGATGRRDDAWARGARRATTWASVRGVRGEVCDTLLGTNPSPRRLPCWQTQIDLPNNAP